MGSMSSSCNTPPFSFVSIQNCHTQNAKVIFFFVKVLHARNICFIRQCYELRETFVPASQVWIFCLSGNCLFWHLHKADI